MNRKTFYLSIAMMIVFVSWAFMGLALAEDIQLKPWKSLKHQTMPYDPTGKIDPFDNSFMNPVEVKESEAEVHREAVKVPETALTKWDLSQLSLTGTILGETATFAAFTAPDHGRCYKGVVGDFIGKDGHRIQLIENGLVEAVLDGQVHVYKINR